MAKIILASHGGLSKGMKDSVSMIVGDLAKDVETYSLLPGHNPEDFYQEVLKEAKESEEQILILCDIKGGSVHTALSKLAVLDNVMVFSGMNMGLALDAVMKSLGGNLELADANACATLPTMMLPALPSLRSAPTTSTSLTRRAR